MKKIGITGGIGSGKTIVCDIFKILGVKVYNSDTRAKELLDTDEEIVKSIKAVFGSEIYVSGKANRKLLAEKVFNNPEALRKLNSIVHPAVFADFDKWLGNHAHEPYIIKEAAIMLESGANKFLDKVVLVYSPVEIRLQRVMNRDNSSRDAVLSRMKKPDG